MGFDIYWSMHRATGLDASERARVASHVARWRDTIVGYDLALPLEPGLGREGLVAWGSLRPSYGDPRRSDEGGYLLDVVEQVLDALSELRKSFEDVQLAVTDDFSTYGWKEGGWQPFTKDAPKATLVFELEGWVWASDQPLAPPELSPTCVAAIAPLLAPVGDASAIAQATIRVEDYRIERDGPDRALWAEALAARLAFDGWVACRWSDAIATGLFRVGARPQWHSLALAVDAGIPECAWALAALADHDILGELARTEHPAWAAFASLLGNRRPPPATPDELVALASACAGVERVRRTLGRVPQVLDHDHDPDDPVPVSDEARDAVAALAALLRPLGLDDDDDDTRPLVAPQRDDTAEDIDIALGELESMLIRRLEPFLAGALPSELRDAWRQAAARDAVALRDRIAGALPT